MDTRRSDPEDEPPPEIAEAAIARGDQRETEAARRADDLHDGLPGAADLRRELSEHLALRGGFAGISVDVLHGRVVLAGTVATEDQRRFALAVARELAGGRRVEDRITVESA